jgi:hypothetical protein
LAPIQINTGESVKIIKIRAESIFIRRISRIC